MSAACGQKQRVLADSRAMVLKIHQCLELVFPSLMFFVLKSLQIGVLTKGSHQENKRLSFEHCPKGGGGVNRNPKVVR